MLAVQLLILAGLGVVFVQDALSRSVHWFLFPLLGLLFFFYRISIHPFADAWPAVLVNNAFLLMQLLLVSAWFSLKRKSWINLTDELLGWGDILFLCCAACYFSVLNFFCFYILSLGIIILAWAIWQRIAKQKDHHIPLAGWQALLLAAVLITDWWLPNIDLTSDEKLYQVWIR